MADWMLGRLRIRRRGHTVYPQERYGSHANETWPGEELLGATGDPRESRDGRHQIRLTTTSEGTQFERATTDREKRAVLDALGRSEFGLDETSVSVSPERERVSLMHVDSAARVMKSVEATGSITTGGGLSSLEVVSETIYTETDLRSEVSAQAECSPDLMYDLIWCIIDYSDCGLCWIGSPAPPVFAACIVIVCFDGSLALVIEYLADFGCSAVGTGGLDCLQQLIDQYGDLIPV